MTDLEKRINRFNRLVLAIGTKYRPHPLIAKIKIDDYSFNSLCAAVCQYLGKSLPSRRICVDGSDAVISVLRERYAIKNITPNGMVVPKSHLVREFNAVIKSFMAIITTTPLVKSLISSWHIPLNIRWKDGEVSAENLTRKYPTEHPHTDSWAGESSQSVTVMIPILGDVKKNFVRYYVPPDSFQESWLGPKDSYQEGAEIAARYKPIDLPYEKGYLYLADFATIHESVRLPQAGPRVSIDTTFAFVSDNETIHPWRENERADHGTMMTIGNTKVFFFPQSENEITDNRGGFKHPTTLVIRDLEEVKNFI